MTRTLFEKVWSDHVVVVSPQGEELLYVDFNLINEGQSFLAFDQLRIEGRRARRPQQHLAVTDHYLPTINRALGPADRPGDLALGFHFAGGLDGFTVRPDPARAMTFRVRSLDRATGQIRVHPVVALGDDGAVISDLRPEIPHDAWARSGPTVPLRMEMRMYRWCLCFGEFVVNWQDLRSGPGQRPRSTT